MTLAERPSQPPAPERVATASPPSAHPGGRSPGRLVALRIVLVAAIGVVLAFVGGGVFDRQLPELVAAATLGPVAAFLLVRRGPAARAIAAVLAILSSLAIAVLAAGGSTGDAVDALTDGPQRLLSTEWPSPDRADVVGAVAVLLAVASAAGAELAQRRRWHLLPLLPPAAAYIVLVGLGAPGGAELRWLAPLGLLGIAFATLRDDRGGDDQLTLLRGERRLLPLVVVAVLLATLVGWTLDLTPRADPRRNDPPVQTAPLLDPVEATLALRALDPPVALHEIRSSTTTVLPDRWRTAALDVYDGQRWMPDLVLRPIGRRLGDADPDAIAYTVRFLDDDLSLVPLPGPPVVVEAPIETDSARTLVRLVERPGPGAEIPVTANLAPTAPDAVASAIATRAVDESVRSLTELARSLSGDGSVLDRLRTLERTMRDDFGLDPDVPGGGIQRALIERFLRDTGRGTEEQFVTAFVLLARSLGVDARVATGYRLDPAPGETDTGEAAVLVRSSEARIWPEVRLVDEGWLAFDPVPPDVVADPGETPVDPQVQTPAAPQPPTAPPPESGDDTPLSDEVEGDQTEGAFSTAVVWLLRAFAIVGILAIPLLVAVAVVIGAKRRRRRRRLRAADHRLRIRGAWATATDALVDAGATIDRSATDREIAAGSEPFAPLAIPQLHRLATLSSAATFGAPARADLLAEDAADCLVVVERAIGDELTRWQRLRWRLSARSLRRSTRSPVLSD